MKLINSLNSKTHIFDFLTLFRIAWTQIIADNQSIQLIDKGSSSHTVDSLPANVHGLKSFDTAVIAYHMMGFGNFK